MRDSINPSKDKPRLRPIACAGLVLFFLAGCTSGGSNPVAETAACRPNAKDFSLFLAGDTILVDPWSDVDDPAFTKLVGEIRSTDAAIANLETVIHEFKGFPQADSGGTYMASPPRIASEIAWAGFDMVAHANNHTFDYGSIGVLETLDNVRKAGLVLAGSGKDLQSAREPAYFHGTRGTVALVATASTYVRYGRAGASRPDLHGRPGLNPLEVSFRKSLPFTGPIEITIPTGARINPEDLKANLDAVRAAREQADIVVFSIHAHGRGRWLPALAHQMIDAGADVFFTHGPHEIHGIEIYRCRPIFYGLGDFAFQDERVRRLPPETYKEKGLKGDASWEEMRDRLEASNRYRLSIGDRWPFLEGVGARVRFGKDGISEVRLFPVDLGFGKPIPIRGRPRIADPPLARKIIADVTDRSKPFGTKVQYLASENAGLIRIP
jgi:poly-gamma-glutamate capsule biosynthesis protein CapA/YwtB (metallophosphatase superfamily)